MILIGVAGAAFFILSIFLAVVFARSFRHLEHQMNLQTQALQRELLLLSNRMNEQLTSSAVVVKDYTRLMGDFQNRLGQLQESTQSMIRIGQDISSLEDILKAPKLRGILGELFLEELLRQLLPQDRYVCQYSFRSGEKVDAVILLGQGMVPVDAKFPLENFKRHLQAASPEEEKRTRRQFLQDVKKHVDSIASKYILPEEGTFDFALMYVPAENVYYETIVKEDNTAEGEGLVSYALKRKVIPVSPNSFYAYLQAVVLGLRGLKIENSAKEILNGLAQLANDFKRFDEDFERLGAQIGHSKTTYEKAQKRLDRFKQQLESIDTQEATPVLPANS